MRNYCVVSAEEIDRIREYLSKGDTSSKIIAEKTGSTYERVKYIRKKYCKLTEKPLLKSDETKRLTKEEYYISIAASVAGRSTCLRRMFGAVIVKDDRVVSTGYNGSPRGSMNCCERGYCEREQLGIAHGQNYEKCRSVHAEANAIIQASPEELKGSTLYLYGVDAATGTCLFDTEPCIMCKRLIINAQIKEIIVLHKISSDGFSVQTMITNPSEWIGKADTYK